MPNNVINKVVYGDRTLIDLTDTTATAETILSGYGAYGADGVWVDGTATAGSLSGHVWQDNEGYIHLDDDGGDMYITTPLNVTTNGTYTAPTGVAYTPVSVQVSSSPTLQAKTNISPTTSSQTITADSGYDGLSSVQINAMPSGTAGTPTAAKGTVSNHSISVTPSVTNTTGYITGSTKTGTAVTVTASELVSGTLTVDSAGTKDVTNYASASIPSGSATPATSISATSATLTANQTNQYITLTKTVSNTPQVSAGYISSGTSGDTSVSLQASATVVSGMTVNPSTTEQTVIGAGTYVANYVKVRGVKTSNLTADNIKDGVTVTVGDIVIPSRIASVTGTYTGGATYTATLTGTPSETSAFVRYNNTYYYTVGDEITFSAGDTMTLSAMGVRYGGDVSIDGTVVASDPDNGVNYNYTLPNHDIIIDCASGSTAHLSVTFPTISITSNGNKQDVHEYYYADVNVSGGGISEAPENDVIFYDYDGTRLYSYSASEFANLSALPANPSHSGLTSQGWNWTLADAKSYVANYGYLNIGQMYDVTDEKTHIFINIASGTEGIPFQLSLYSTASGTLDWGDTSTNTISGGDTQTHTYSSAGTYEITIDIPEGTYRRYLTSESILGTTNTISSTNALNQTRILSIWVGKRMELTDYTFKSLYSLKSIILPKTGVTPSSTQYLLQYATSLEHITYPSTWSSIGGYINRNNYGLVSVSLPKEITSFGIYAFYGCYSLRRAIIPPSITLIPNYSYYQSYSHPIIIPSSVTEIGQYAFYQNYGGLESVTIPSGVTKIGNYAFCQLYSVLEWHIKPTTPPTLYSSTFANFNSNATMYVPYSADHSILEAYKTASNWSSYASYMVEESP